MLRPAEHLLLMRSYFSVTQLRLFGGAKSNYVKEILNNQESCLLTVSNSNYLGFQLVHSSDGDVRPSLLVWVMADPQRAGQLCTVQRTSPPRPAESPLQKDSLQH